MITIITALNSAAVIAGFVYWVLETKRRKAAEAEIFRILNEYLKDLKVNHEDHEKLLKCYSFLYRRSNFHRGLINNNRGRMNMQEACFSAFGSFIADLARAVAPDPKDITRKEKELKRLFRKYITHSPND